MSLSHDHKLLATCSLDKTIKIFDLLNYDLIRLLKLGFPVGGCDFVKGAQLQ